MKTEREVKDFIRKNLKSRMPIQKSNTDSRILCFLWCSCFPKSALNWNNQIFLYPLRKDRPLGGEFGHWEVAWDTSYLLQWPSTWIHDVSFKFLTIRGEGLCKSLQCPVPIVLNWSVCKPFFPPCCLSLRLLVWTLERPWEQGTHNRTKAQVLSLAMSLLLPIS